MDLLFSPKVSAMSAYRYGVERESLCFRSIRMCATTDTNGNNWDQYGPLEEMACIPCPDAHYSHGQQEDDNPIRDIVPALSKCTWNYFLRKGGAEIPINGKDGWVNKGTYTATCFLEEDTKAGCKFPETCEETMVTIQGVVFGINKAIRQGAKTPVGNAGGIPPCSATSGFITQDATASLQNYVSEKAPSKVATGPIELMIGGFTVHATHPLKYKSGTHQYTTFFEITEEDSNLPSLEGLPKFGDRVHKFDFIGDAKPHY